MAGLNKVQLIGNLGADPEMKFTQNGTARTRMSVAVTRTYTVDGEKQDDTQWFSVITWGKLGEMVDKYLNKGRRVYVEGRIENYEYQTDDGETRRSWNVVAQDVQFLDSARSDQGAASYDGDASGDDDSGL